MPEDSEQQQDHDQGNQAMRAPAWRHYGDVTHNKNGDLCRSLLMREFRVQELMIADIKRVKLFQSICFQSNGE